MFILHDLLLPLQAQFSNTAQGQRRKAWFVYTLLAVIVPFILLAATDCVFLFCPQPEDKTLKLKKKFNL